jgi:glycosyltransferase involved in cell wall biosynthesis
MKISIIIAVYQDIKALDLIISTLRYQTYTNFEIIIAEDGCDEKMQAYVQNIHGLNIKHTTQDDLGVRKARSQNNAVLASTGEYLIFIDGDCPLYCTFIESHFLLAEKGSVLSGRRLNLNNDLTLKLRNGTLTCKKIEKNILWKYLYLAFDKYTRYEQGIYISPKSWIYEMFIKQRKRNTSILGCNFSCFKDDLVALNGFDESYGESAVSDDMDLDWRFRANGLRLKSCKNSANMFHLFHKAHDRGDASLPVSLMREREAQGKFVCAAGLNTH